MRATDRIHIVGSGRNGISLPDSYDCHVYLLDGGGDYALIDAGAGRDVDGIVAAIERDGLDPRRVRHLLLTHAHAAGAVGLRERLGVRILASPPVAAGVRAGDEAFASLDVARRAGAYPEDFVLRPCPVDAELADGDTVSVSDLTVEAVATPGGFVAHGWG